MTAKDVLTELRKSNHHVWQLCQRLGWSRSAYYDRSHSNFKGYEKQIKSALERIGSND